jgi:hypothetical protein
MEPSSGLISVHLIRTNQVAAWDQQMAWAKDPIPRQFGQEHGRRTRLPNHGAGTVILVVSLLLYARGRLS